MCTYRPRRYERPELLAWKVFIKTGASYSALYYNHRIGGDNLVPGEIYCSEGNIEYDSKEGFHAFRWWVSAFIYYILLRINREGCCMKKVKLYDIRWSAVPLFLRSVVVAKRMEILEN